MAQETFRLTIDLPVEEHKRLKTLSALYGKPMRDLILEALKKSYREEGSNSINVPNYETIKAIEEAERGEGIVKCSSIEDLFKKLGI